MTTLSKNHAARLKRVDQRLDRSLDALMQANGELWPSELRPYGTRLQEAVNILQELSKDVRAHIEGATVKPDPEDSAVDPDQEDIEDVSQEQPETAGRRRRSAA